MTILSRLSKTEADKFHEDSKGGANIINKVKKFCRDNAALIIAGVFTVGSIVLAATGKGIVESHLAISTQSMIGIAGAIIGTMTSAYAATKKSVEKTFAKYGARE